MKFYKFLLQRILTFVLVVFIGITTVFFVPRFLPSDPVESMITQMQSKAGTMTPAEMESIRKVLNDAFGLDGSLWDQYTGFLKRAILTQDFGPSFSSYPTPVIEIIGRALPWTLGLLLATTIIAWIFGNLIGLLAGFKPHKAYSKILEGISIVIYPIPYYIFALALIMLFCYIIPAFPLSFVVRGTGFEWFKNMLYNCFLPALSLILVGFGWWVISMKTVVLGLIEEDYVRFARLKGLSETKIMMKYVMPNATLPQVTNLALRIGGIFSGSMITEMLFGFPGIGKLIQTAVWQADYNMIMGTITISILAVSVTTFLIDMLYPFIDPRIRYR